MKKFVLLMGGLAIVFNSLAARATSESVVYRCPAVNEIDAMETRTTFNHKTVE